MDDATRQLEARLGKLQPPALSHELMARLEAAADGSLLNPSALMQSQEARMETCRPASLSPSLLDSLERTMAGIDFQTASRVVAFPTTRSASHPLHQWSAAAAVALLGALCALWLQQPDKQTDPTAHQKPIHSAGGTTPLASPDSGHIIPADAIRRISNTSDEGVIWHSEHPHRVLKVVYLEQVTLKQPDGSSRVVERPRIEYYLVPTESN